MWTRHHNSLMKAPLPLLQGLGCNYHYQMLWKLNNSSRSNLPGFINVNKFIERTETLKISFFLVITSEYFMDKGIIGWTNLKHLTGWTYMSIILVTSLLCGKHGWLTFKDNEKAYHKDWNCQLLLLLHQSQDLEPNNVIEGEGLR